MIQALLHYQISCASNVRTSENCMDIGVVWCIKLLLGLILLAMSLRERPVRGYTSNMAGVCQLEIFVRLTRSPNN